MEGKIKRISIGVEIPKQFHYGVGSVFPVYIDNKRIETVINNIEETEKNFLIYAKYNGEVHLWKKIGKHEFITVEMFID
jgi:hypothetical protein